MEGPTLPCCECIHTPTNPVSCTYQLPSINQSTNLRSRPQEYYAAGQFTPKARLLQSLRANLKFYSILGAPILVFIIYIVASKTVSFKELIPFVLTLANTFGLCLIFLMMGYGLVEVPRSLWRESRPVAMLRLLQYKAPDMDEAVYDCKVALEEVVAQVGCMA